MTPSNSNDTLSVRITDDGLVVIEADEVSTGNHRSADNLLDALQRDLTNQQVQVQPRKAQHHHTEQANQAHQH